MDHGTMLQIKEESKDVEVDIGPTTFQHTDSPYRTSQDVSVVKQENAANEDNVDTNICSEVKQESIEVSLTGVDGQKCAEDTSTQAGAGSGKQGFYVTVEGTNLVIVPLVRQHRSDQNTNIVKRENVIARDGNDPESSSRVKKQNVEDNCGAATGSILFQRLQSPNNMIPSEQRIRSELYSCDKCAQVFNSKDIFSQHCRLAHLTQPGKHNECNKKFLFESSCRISTSYHGKLQYECAVCKKIFKSKECLRNHVKNYHRLWPRDTEHKIYVCDYCQKTFTRKYMIIDHISCMHGSGSYKCNICESSFKSKKYLRIHATNVHTLLKKECNVCGKFMKLNHLSGHMRSAHSDVELLCKICGEIMMSKQQLQQHVNDVHSQQSALSPFVNRCGYCQKIFTTRSTLMVHIRNMHGKASHICSECKVAFKREDHLQMHMKLVHAKKEHEASNQPSTNSNYGENSESTHPTVGELNALMSTSTQQLDTKQEPAEEELELGPVVFQHMDCNYRPHKEEPSSD